MVACGSSRSSVQAASSSLGSAAPAGVAVRLERSCLGSSLGELRTSTNSTATSKEDGSLPQRDSLYHLRPRPLYPATRRTASLPPQQTVRHPRSATTAYSVQSRPDDPARSLTSVTFRPCARLVRRRRGDGGRNRRGALRRSSRSSRPRRLPPDPEPAEAPVNPRVGGFGPSKEADEVGSDETASRREQHGRSDPE